MNLIYFILPILVILSVITISITIPVEAQTGTTGASGTTGATGTTGVPTPPEPELESRYAFDIYLVFDDVNRASAIQVKDAFKNKSETYPLKDHFQDWSQKVEEHNGRDLAILWASFTFDTKDDCKAFYNWIIDNMPQNIKDDILYGKILVLDNTHHYPNDEILPDVIVFENTIGSLDDANFQY